MPWWKRKRNVPESWPLALDDRAAPATPGRPAFLSKPPGAPVYYGFPIVEDLEVDGFRLGMITDFEASPESGDAYIDPAPATTKALATGPLPISATVAKDCGPLRIAWRRQESRNGADPTRRPLRTMVPTNRSRAHLGSMCVG